VKQVVVIIEVYHLSSRNKIVSHFFMSKLTPYAEEINGDR